MASTLYIVAVDRIAILHNQRHPESYRPVWVIFQPTQQKVWRGRSVIAIAPGAKMISDGHLSIDGVSSFSVWIETNGPLIISNLDQDGREYQTRLD